MKTRTIYCVDLFCTLKIYYYTNILKWMTGTCEQLWFWYLSISRATWTASINLQLDVQTEMKLKWGYFVFSAHFVQGRDPRMTLTTASAQRHTFNQQIRKYLAKGQLPARGTDILSPFRVDDQPFEPIQLQLNEGIIEGRRLKVKFRNLGSTFPV